MRKNIICLIFLLCTTYVFADYNQDLELRKLLDDISGFIEYQDESISSKYFSANEYITLLKQCILVSNQLDVVMNAKEYFDEYCKKIIEYDESNTNKLTYHDFREWTANYIRTNKGEFQKLSMD